MNDKYIEALDELIKYYRGKIEDLEVIKLEYIRKLESERLVEVTANASLNVNKLGGLEGLA